MPDSLFHLRFKILLMSLCQDMMKRPETCIEQAQYNCFDNGISYYMDLPDYQNFQSNMFTE